MKDIPKCDWGPPDLRKYLDKLCEAIRARTPNPDGVTVMGDHYPSGIYLRAIGSGIGGDAAIHPLQCLPAGTTDDPRIRVIYGTIGGVEAVGMSPGDSSPFTFSPVGSSGYAYAILTFVAAEEEDESGIPSLDNWEVEAFGSQQPYGTLDMTTGEGTIRHLLCSYSASPEEGLTVASNLTGSQAYIICGTSVTFGVI